MCACMCVCVSVHLNVGIFFLFLKRTVIENFSQNCVDGYFVNFFFVLFLNFIFVEK